jgi:hypothetical protein
MFNNPVFRSVLSRIFNTQVPIKASYHIMKLQKQLQEEETTFEKLKRKIVDTYAVKDEQGQPTVDPEKGVLFGDNQETADAEYNSLLSIDVPIKRRLDFQTLSHFTLSGVEFTVLEQAGVVILDEDEDEDEDEQSSDSPTG